MPEKRIYYIISIRVVKGEKYWIWIEFCKLWCHSATSKNKNVSLWILFQVFSKLSYIYYIFISIFINLSYVFFDFFWFFLIFWYIYYIFWYIYCRYWQIESSFLIRWVFVWLIPITNGTLHTSPSNGKMSFIVIVIVIFIPPVLFQIRLA